MSNVSVRKYIQPSYNICNMKKILGDKYSMLYFLLKITQYRKQNIKIPLLLNPGQGGLLSVLKVLSNLYSETILRI